MASSETPSIGSKTLGFKLFSVKDLVDDGVLAPPLDGNHGEIHPTTDDYVSSGIPFVMASDIANGLVNYSNCKFITRKLADSLRKGFAKNGDVLLTHKATIGRTAIVNYPNEPYVMLTPQVTYYRVKNSNKLNNTYLRYYFDSSFFQQLIHLWAGSGSTRAYIGITEQAKLPVVVPHIETQQKIAAILSAYDDLIANNQRRITLLERMAEDIYREWFVRLRFPGHEQTKIEKGVPKGWTVAELGSACALIKRGVAPNYSETSSLLMLNQRCIRDGVVDFAEARGHDTKVPREKFVQYGDVLINSTGVGTLGRVAIFDHELTNATCDTHVTICRGDAEVVNVYYLGLVLRSLQGYFESLAIGSTGQSELGREAIGKTEIVLPAMTIQQKFAAVAEPIWQQKRLLQRQVRTLSVARDALLPRLISGKLAVDALAIRFPPSFEDAIAPK
jgi:type I restriction enzyme, S subunit